MGSGALKLANLFVENTRQNPGYAFQPAPFGFLHRSYDRSRSLHYRDYIQSCLDLHQFLWHIFSVNPKRPEYITTNLYGYDLLGFIDFDFGQHGIHTRSTLCIVPDIPGGTRFKFIQLAVIGLIVNFKSTLVHPVLMIFAYQDLNKILSRAIAPSSERLYRTHIVGFPQVQDKVVRVIRLR